MATSSILGGERAPNQPGGKDIEALGPSDNSDSGSDSASLFPEGADTDSNGTGERASVGRAGNPDVPADVRGAKEARDFAAEQERSTDA